MTWQSVCADAVATCKDLPLAFMSPYQDMKGKEGSCRLIGAVIEASEDYDEESLPVYLVELEDGTHVEALEEELSSDDSAGFQRLIEGVSMTFGLARVLGDWAGPAHLMEDADEPTRERFLRLINSSHAEKAEKLA